MKRMLRTILGEYEFKNYCAVDIIHNSSQEVYYTELHEHTHKKITSTTSFGLYAILLNICSEYSNINSGLRRDLVKKMVFVQESHATLTELCHHFDDGGEEKFNKELQTLKKYRNDYYRYFKPSEFLFQYFDHQEVHELSENITRFALNVNVNDIPTDDTQRKKFFSTSENAMKYLPNSRYKEMCKMVEKCCKGELGHEELRSWVNDYNCSIDFNEEYIDSMKSFVLDKYVSTDGYREIEKRFTNIGFFDSKLDTFAIYPTLLNSSIDDDSFEKINWRECKENPESTFSVLTFSKVFNPKVIPLVIIPTFNNGSKKHYKKYISYMESNDVNEFLEDVSNKVVLIGNKGKVFDFFTTYKNNIVHMYQFIDNALIDSINYFNTNFTNARYRVFNYQALFSVMVVSDGNLKVLQPVSIHAYNHIQLACQNVTLSLIEATVDSNEYDDFIVRNSEEKRELDTIISLIYFNLYNKAN